MTSVFFCAEARKTIDNELRRFPDYETGGVLFGRKISGTWIVEEACGAGNHSCHDRSSFELDMGYAQKYAESYLRNNPSKHILGIWHKHNHCLHPPLSNEDILTSEQYAKINEFGCLSMVAMKYKFCYVVETYHFSTENAMRKVMLTNLRRIRMM